MRNPATPKLIFADHLRGIAALLVVLCHLGGVYWTEPDLVARVTFSPQQTGAMPPWTTAIQHLPIDLGAFGVGLFFLISGFVLPNSFVHHTASSFLVARFLRIWPSYLTALLIGVLAVWLSAWFWGQPMVLPVHYLLANALLVQNLVGVPSFDLVNWTLAVEVKFYLLFALAHGAILRRPGVWALGLGLLSLGLCALVPLALGASPASNAAKLLRAVAMDIQYLPYMLIGTLAHAHWRGAVKSGPLVLLVLGTLALTGSAAWLLGLAVQFQTVWPNEVAACGVFMLAYAAQNRIPNLLLPRLLARISYPLYLVHALTGYAVMQALTIGLGWSSLTAFAVAVGLALVIATLIHLAIEVPSIAAGRARGRQIRSAGFQPAPAE